MTAEGNKVIYPDTVRFGKRMEYDFGSNKGSASGTAQSMTTAEVQALRP